MEQKPGYKSSEFWVTLATSLVSVIALFLKLGPEQTGDAVAQASRAAVEVFALISMAVTTWRYVKGREEIKKTASETEARSQEVAARSVTSPAKKE